ncbi:MAG: tRNA pseudouridine(38-40) synthase TruA [Thermocladium sp.]
MPRFAYLIMYDGSAFNGFTGGPGTIEHILRRVFTRLNKSPVDIAKASRTDPGVSALMNVIAVNLSRELPIGLINSKLPPQVRIWGVAMVGDDFNPRNAIQRKYLFFAQWRGEDASLMKQAASIFIGKHDLRNYMINDGSPTIVEIYDINIDIRGGLIMVRFIGHGFRNKMLRKIMNAILMAGRGEVELKHLSSTIDTSIMAPIPPHDPHGLILEEVKYKDQLNFTIDAGARTFFARYLKKRLMEVSSMLASYEYLLSTAINDKMNNKPHPF